MTVRLSAVGGAYEIRHLAVDWARLDTDYELDLEVVADAAHDECRIACSKADWLDVSSDAGATWDDVPTTVQSGVDLGAVTAGQRIEITLRLRVPAATTDDRLTAVELYLGTGV